MDLRLATSNITALYRETAAAVDFISKVPKIRHEYDAFKLEVDILESMSKAIQDDNSSPTHHTLRSRVIDQLGEVISELQKVKEKCDNHAKGGIAKIKWVLGENDIGKLRGKAGEAKQNLSLLLDLEQRERMNDLFTQSRQVQILLQQKSGRPQIVHEDTSLANTKTIEEPSDNSEISDDDSCGEVEEIPENQITRGEPTPPLAVRRRDTQYSGSLTRSWSGITPMTLTGCSKECQCRCHFDQPTSFIGFLFKSFIYSQDSIACDAGCKRKDVGRYRSNNRTLQRLGLARLELRLYHSLRAPRLISSYDAIWQTIKAPFEVMEQFARNEFNYFPDEQSVDGSEIVDIALQEEAWDFLELLLHVLWKNLLPVQGLPRRAATRANYMLENSRLTDRQVYLVKLAKSYVRDVDELRRTQLFEAVMWGDDIDKALQQQPWAMDVLDYTGDAPMHWAAYNGDTAALQSLINAGADINIKDWLGWTPLMQAARYDELDSVRLLLDAKCSVHMQAGDGRTALHFAVEFASPEITAALLRAGASVTTRDTTGEVPLHQIPKSTKNEEVLNNHLFQLLAKNPEIDPRDNRGQTPSLLALAWNNLPALRCFVRAGASLLVTDRASSNILHFAALYSPAEVLRYLQGLDLTSVDVKLQDEDNRSPWDSFIYTKTQGGASNGFRHPNSGEEQLFLQLYQETRNKNTRTFIHWLKQTSHSLAKLDAASALKNIEPFIKQMDDWNRDDALHQCWEIQAHIDEGRWSQATDMINKLISNLEAEMHSSPRDQPTPYDSYLYSSSEEEDDYNDDDDDTDNGNHHNNSHDEDYDDETGDEDDGSESSDNSDNDGHSNESESCVLK